jgi:hypothetical protein
MCFARLPAFAHAITLRGQCARSPASFVVDSGAESWFVSTQYAALPQLSLPAPSRATVVVVDGTQHRNVPKYTYVSIHLGSPTNSLTFTTDLYALDLPGYDVILGKPWLQRFNPDINWQTNTLSLPVHSCRGPIVLQHYPPQATPTNMYLSATQLRRLSHQGAEIYMLSIKQVDSDLPEPSLDLAKRHPHSPHAASVIEEFKDVFPPDLPNTLPP